MDFTCPKDAFTKAVQIVEKAVATKTTLPVINHIQIEAKKNDILLTANDLEVGIEISLPAKIKKEGLLLVPAKTFANIIGKLPNADVHLKAGEKNAVEIRCSQAKFVIYGLPAEDFPALPQVKSDWHLEISAADLTGLIDLVLFSASSDESKRLLNGVLLEISGGQLVAVATDGYRLAKKEVKVAYDRKEKISVVVPAKAMAEIAAIIDQGGSDTVKVFFSQDQIAFRFGEVYLASRLIQGQFPDYRQVIPKEVPLEMAVKRKELAEAAERVAIIASGSANVMKVDQEDGQLVLQASTPNVGSVQETVPVEVAGSKKIPAAFNIRLINEVMKHLSCDKIKLGLTGTLTPGVITAQGDPSYIYVVMPIRAAAE